MTDYQGPPVPSALAPGTKQIVTLKPPIDETTRKWQLSSSDLIEEIRQYLKGNYFNENHNRWERLTEPWMNDEGIGRLSNILAFYINKNVQLSYFEEFHIENLICDFAKELSEFMRFHYKKYGVSKEHVGMISTMLCDIVFAALMRARLGKESQFIENTEQRTITTSEGQQQSPLSRIPIIGRLK